MKKTILSIFMTALCVNLFAWELDLGLNAGLRVGMNLSSVTAVGDDSDLYEKGSSLLGFNIGAFYDYEIAESFFLQPGLSFTTRGTDFSDELADRVKINYLQAPILASYRFSLGEKQRFALNCGATFGYAVSGKSLYEEYNVDGNIVKNSSSIFGGDDTYNRFEVGVNLGVNYYIKSHYINISWERGLSNLYVYEGADCRLKNNTLSVIVGYTF